MPWEGTFASGRWDRGWLRETLRAHKTTEMVGLQSTSDGEGQSHSLLLSLFPLGGPYRGWAAVNPIFVDEIKSLCLVKVLCGLFLAQTPCLPLPHVPFSPHILLLCPPHAAILLFRFDFLLNMGAFLSPITHVLLHWLLGCQPSAIPIGAPSNSISSFCSCWKGKGTLMFHILLKD